MSSYNSYPKLWALGHPNISMIFAEPVVIEEKVDGSQFSFGEIDGILRARSKNVEINLDDAPDLFAPAVETVRRLHSEGKLIPDWTYRGEAIRSRKHNSLTYKTVPPGNVVLFDIATGHEAYLGYDEKANVAVRMGLWLAPKLFEGVVSSVADLNALMDRESFLGGAKIEGLVVKNNARFGYDGKPLFGKRVSSAFKEINNANWREMKVTSGDIIDKLAARYATEQRWQKAVQHLRDAGTLQHAPQDIGPLMKEVNLDVLAECKEEIKEIVFKWAWEKLSRRLTHGLPMWWKAQLMFQQFPTPEAKDRESAA